MIRRTAVHCFPLMLMVLLLHCADLKIYYIHWYLIGFATNAQWFVNRKTSMKMSMAIGFLEALMALKSAEVHKPSAAFHINNDMSRAEVKYDDGFSQFSLETGILAFFPKNGTLYISGNEVTPRLRMTLYTNNLSLFFSFYS
uniref:Uncharacterized protein n=1 Tax=Monopterus albus TaxID=43700 RepID=A0A3Q3QWH5_MONAL